MKERKEEQETHRHSIVRIRTPASPPAVSFACRRLQQVAKAAKYKIHLFSEYYVTITQPTV